MKSVVKRRPFGATGLMVSEVSLGAMNLRMLDTEDQARELLNYVLDQGINLIDTARGYKGINGSGVEVQSEALVGEVLASRTDLDEPIIIVSKCHGYSPEAYDEDLKATYETMGIRKTDKGLFIGPNEIKLVYFYHGIKADRWEDIKASGALETGKKHLENGDISFLGFSAHYGDTDTIREALDTGLFSVIELPYNIFNRSLGEDGSDMLKYAHDKGVAIVNMKAFNGNGMRANEKITNDIVNIPISKMLQFCLANENVSVIDAGARFPEEFKADIEASLAPALTAEEIAALKADADKVAFVLNNNICRECMHCLEKFECPQGINFPAILGNYARYCIAKEVGKDTAPYVAKYKTIEGPLADSCLACGACMEWCEYHLNIPDMMAQVRDEME